MAYEDIIPAFLLVVILAYAISQQVNTNHPEWYKPNHHEYDEDDYPE